MFTRFSMPKIGSAAAGAALLLVALPFGQALAGKPVKGDPTLIVSPNPVAAYSTYHISGCGYTLGVNVILVMQQPTAVASTGATVDSTGCISRDWNSNGQGSYTLSAYQNLGGPKPTLMASTAVTVH